MDGGRLLALLAGLAVALALVGWGFAMLRNRQLISTTPTSKCAGVFMGWNEVSGVAATDHPTTSHLARLPCVLWNYTIEHEVRVTHHHTTTDSEGHTSTTTSTSHEWRVIEQDGASVGPFSVVDDTGNVLVDPARAKVQPRTVVDQVSGERRGGFFVSDGPTGRLRHREYVIAVGDAVYVTGTARLRDDAAAPVIDDAGEGPFVVTTRGEDSVQSGYAFGGPALLALALAVGIGASLFAFTRRGEPARPVAGVPGGVLVAVIISVASLALVYNGLVRVRNRVDRAYSLIDVMLQRRHDLIPRLVASVEGARAHEASVQVAVTELRSGSIPVEAATAEVAAQTAVLRTVIARAEAYPELATNANYLALQAALRDTEDRVAAARSFYNDSVTELHDAVQAFPGVLVARFGDFPTRPLFAAEGLDRVTPHVATSDVEPR